MQLVRSEWPVHLPLLGVLFIAGGMSGLSSALFMSLMCVGLLGAVIAAVHHAEVIAHRIGEPYGTLVLALAVTVIEVALVLSLMMIGGSSAAALPRSSSPTSARPPAPFASGRAGSCCPITTRS